MSSSPGSESTAAQARKGAAPMLVAAAEYRVSTVGNVDLVADCVGSGLAVSLHDPGPHVGGLLHVVLPLSKVYSGSKLRGAMFVDTGIPMLLDAVVRAGARPEYLRCKIFGGAQLGSPDSFFATGDKNVAAAEAICADLRLPVAVSETGGHYNRSVRLRVESGIVTVSIPTHPPRDY